ncbi:uncharacterized protein LOC106668885 [Cimex lectularius]|uniref:Uncharacterized protein n=1 Tax=Cimex lectularius TaxID=79782 RepID=A0A8I6S0U2_CIMLE|nr:uncharacterized protein LOC106668885 [Cimex lectularius]
MARQAQHSWTKHLPIGLLGIRSTLNTEEHSPAQMIFETSLRLTGDFLVPSEESRDHDTYIRELQESMALVRPERRRPARTSFIPKDLMTCSHVYLKVEGIRRTLIPPYEGPYEVLARSKKTIRIRLEDRETTVSIDKVKPAYLACDLTSSATDTQPTNTETDPAPQPSSRPQETASTPTLITRSGRIVRKKIMYNV